MKHAVTSIAAKVVSIGDGDTTVQQSNRKVTIQLSCVDAKDFRISTASNELTTIRNKLIDIEMPFNPIC